MLGMQREASEHPSPTTGPFRFKMLCFTHKNLDHVDGTNVVPCGRAPIAIERPVLFDRLNQGNKSTGRLIDKLSRLEKDIIRSQINELERDLKMKLSGLNWRFFWSVACLIALAPAAFAGNLIQFDEDGHLLYTATPIQGTAISGGGTHWVIFDVNHRYPNVLVYAQDEVTPIGLVVFDGQDGGRSMDFYALGTGHQASVAALPPYSLANLLTTNENSSDKFSFDNDFAYRGTFEPDLTPSVPEPSTWAMMILGFVGVGLMAYRRKSKPLAA